MATLSLKKPNHGKLIGNIPLIEMRGKYAIMRQSRSGKNMRFTCIHESIDLANKEAQRLHIAAPTERFLVMQVVDHIERAV
jgi:hypothetical protein